MYREPKPESSATLQAFADRLRDILGRPKTADDEDPEQLAGVLTLWRNLDAPEVTSQDMANGITLAEYYLSEALRLADAAMISLEIERAERLRDWLHKSWPNIAQSKGRNPQFVLPGDVTQFGPNSLRDTKTAKAALGVLVQHGWLQPLEKGVIVDDATRREAYAVT